MAIRPPVPLIQVRPLAVQPGHPVIPPRLDLAQTEIQPPAAFWVTPDDVLVVGVRNSLVGVQIGVQVRVLTETGELSNPNIIFTPPADRSLNYKTVPMYYGYLNSVSAFAISPGGLISSLPVRGQTYVTLHVIRQPLLAFTSVIALGSGYIAGSNFVQWPYGRVIDAIEGPGALYNIVITNPAPGVDWTQLVPTNARWRIRSIVATFTASAVVATRIPRLVFFPSGLFTAVFEGPVTITAGQAFQITWAAGFGVAGFQGVAANLFMPAEMILMQAGLFKVQTQNLQAGDQWSSIVIYVEEWLED